MSELDDEAAEAAKKDTDKLVDVKIGVCASDSETEYSNSEVPEPYNKIVGTYACGATSLAASVTMAAIATVSYMQ